MSKEVINAWLSKSNPQAWFDIDGTIKHADNKYPNGFNPMVVGVLFSLREMAGTSACTEQSPQELASFGAIFSGPSILEGGHVLVDKGKSIEKDYQILTSEAAKVEMQAMVNMFNLHKVALD